MSETRVVLYGTSSRDHLRGGMADEVIYARGGNDVLEGGDGADELRGGAGINTASYEHATTSVTASFDSPFMNSNDAEGDTYANIQNLRGSAYDDFLEGDSGNNVIEGGLGSDYIFGLVGRDTVSYVHSSSGVTVALNSGTYPQISGGDADGDFLFFIEDIRGSLHDDSLTGDHTGNILDGFGSDGPLGDSLYGLSGNDTLKVQGNPAMVDGGTGKDTLVMKAGASVTLSDANFTAVEKVFVQNGGTLDMSDVTGAVYIRSFSTSGHSVSITGTEGDDLIQAGAGADTFHFNEPGFGHDCLIGVDLANDALDFAGLAGSLSDLSIRSINGGTDTEVTIIGQPATDAVVLKGIDAATVLTDGHFLF